MLTPIGTPHEPCQRKQLMDVATITGHKDTRMLMRYTHLRAEDLANSED